MSNTNNTEKEAKLTAQIASAYFGCHITDKYSEGKTYKMVGLSEDEGNMQVYSGLKDTDWWNISELKLVLKPLSKITDIDAIEVARIILPNYFANMQKGWLVSRNYSVTNYPYIKVHHPKKVSSIQIDCTLINFDVDGMEDRETGSHDMKPAAVIDHLRSKGYDCGYGSIPSLIVAGVAVEK